MTSVSRSEYQRVWREANRERLLAAKRQYHQDNREAELARMKAAYHANPTPGRERAKAYAMANPELERVRLKKRYEANREAELALRREHYANNKAAYVARAKQRKLMLISRVPNWADPVATAAVYKEAEEIRKLGVDVHVDHFFPLQGETVCGLHVHTNLRIMLASENIAKSNKLVAVE